LTMLFAGCMSLGMAGAYAADTKKDTMGKDAMKK
jgi:hypothetical protein